MAASTHELVIYFLPGLMGRLLSKTSLNSRRGKSDVYTVRAIDCPFSWPTTAW